TLAVLPGATHGLDRLPSPVFCSSVRPAQCLPRERVTRQCVRPREPKSVQPFMPKVLIFESDTRFADELKRGLEQQACAVTVVGDATEGLQLAANNRPDMILLTVELPRVNGFSVCNKLKRDPSLKSVPLIIMSSDSNEDTFAQHRRLKHSRAEDYVHKPISFTDLLPRISALVPLDEPEVELEAEELETAELDSADEVVHIGEERA